MLRTILIILAILLIVRLIQSYIKPSQKSKTNNSYRGANYTNRKEGETRIEDLNTKKGKKIPKSEGDYVDYEEL